MRIRKRNQNPLPSPDLYASPHPPPNPAAVPAAPSVAAAGGATGDKEGRGIAATAAVLHVPDGGCGGGEGRGGLHPNGFLQGRPHPDGHDTKPTTCLPFPPLLSAGGGERGDLPRPGPRPAVGDVLLDGGRHGEEVPRREQDGENGGHGDASGRWNLDAHSTGRGGGNATSPKSSGAGATEASVGHGGHKMLLVGGTAAGVAEAAGRWSDEDFQLKKRREGSRARGRRSAVEVEEEEQAENLIADQEMKPRPTKTKRRRTAAAAFTTTTMGAAADNGGAPSAAGAVAAKKSCVDGVVKEEGGDVVSAVGEAAAVDGNRGGASGKKRRSPAVLMEGSRCSRVNGRGWRCCQQTLVGYSLCEHHLGKGRLRSVSSVRCNGRPRKKEEADGAAPSLPSLLLQQRDRVSPGDAEDEEDKPGKRRRNKIGMVKARSISSLLHQPDHSTPARITAAPELAFPSPSPAPANATVTTAAPAAYGQCR